MPVVSRDAHWINGLLHFDFNDGGLSPINGFGYNIGKPQVLYIGIP